MRNLNIGLFGFGVVGECIYEVLSQKNKLGCSISKIAIKDPKKKRNAPASLFTTNPDNILLDKEIDVIVELIDDAEAAFAIAKKAMNNGKSLVSANKKMIAENHLELIKLQKENKVSFLYEAAVCGSIPILRNLEEYFGKNLLKYVSGIVNGSTNYILTKMKNEQVSYYSSLKTVQENGLAETNPALDVEAIDAAYKLSIITLHAFGNIIDPATIVRKGITSLKQEDFQYAEEKGLVIKLIANSSLDESSNSLNTNVFPTFLKKEKTLSSVNDEYNGVLIGSFLADEQFFYGKGAGRYPTSSAILNDISALKHNYKYGFKKGYQIAGNSLSSLNKKFYIACGRNAEINLKIFDSIEEHYKNSRREYVIGNINLNKLNNFNFWKNKNISLIVFN